MLTDALTHFQMVTAYAERDLSDQLTIDAACMRLSAGIETLASLDDAAREKYFGAAWPQMWAMRNRIAHGYLLVDPAIVRRTVHQDVPPIAAAIERGLKDLS